MYYHQKMCSNLCYLPIQTVYFLYPYSAAVYETTHRYDKCCLENLRLVIGKMVVKEKSLNYAIE